MVYANVNVVGKTVYSYIIEHDGNTLTRVKNGYFEFGQRAEDIEEINAILDKKNSELIWENTAMVFLTEEMGWEYILDMTQNILAIRTYLPALDSQDVWKMARKAVLAGKVFLPKKEVG